MEHQSLAHALPELYRVVLERIASLELVGQRAEAEQIRREAIEAYSRAWDDRAHRRLEGLRGRAERLLDAAGRVRRGEAVATVSGPRPV